ncbi:hypothetical protein [uncultured Clostridium sp.]|uniref:hypothetical protein n=1 Tax=uncultured Clostridium sp. TaxID=59620 RepID=UPI002730249C|nr:hypothetical protein [uncultured Clostridium sp.]
MIELIKVGAVAYIAQKALKCFGKRDFADIIAFCGWCSIGVTLIQLILNVLDGITNSEIVKLITYFSN